MQKGTKKSPHSFWREHARGVQDDSFCKRLSFINSNCQFCQKKGKELVGYSTGEELIQKGMKLVGYIVQEKLVQTVNSIPGHDPQLSSYS